MLLVSLVLFSIALPSPDVHADTSMLSLPANQHFSQMLRTSFGLDPCHPENHHFDAYAQQYGYHSYSETPHCKVMRFLLGDK